MAACTLCSKGATDNAKEGESSVSPHLAAKLAEHVREYYSWENIEKRDLNEPMVVEDEYGFKSLSLPREQMFEPYRNFRLRDVGVIDTVLIIAFAWGPPVSGEDDHIYLLPLDTRKVLIDPWDDRSIATLVAHHLEFTLGCPIETWEAARAVPVGERTSFVKPWENESGLP